MNWETMRLPALVGGVFLVLVLLITMCSVGGKPSFADLGKTLCDSVDSKPLFSSEEKKVVICE